MYSLTKHGDMELLPNMKLSPYCLLTTMYGCCLWGECDRTLLNASFASYIDDHFSARLNDSDWHCIVPAYELMTGKQHDENA